MINKKIKIDELKEIFNEYKNSYNPIINEFTHIYSYILDERVVAFLIFSVMYDKCEIIDIYVSNDYRRNHIAENLINEIKNDYKIENITLEVNEENIGAIKLYEKLGFKKVAIRKNYYGNQNGFLMIKEIR